MLNDHRDCQPVLSGVIIVQYVYRLHYEHQRNMRHERLDSNDVVCQKATSWVHLKNKPKNARFLVITLHSRCVITRKLILKSFFLMSPSRSFISQSFY